MKIFIDFYGYDHNWIMGIIADDIKRTAESLGIQCRCGKRTDYVDEEIYYHLAYQVAVPNPKAKHNSVFYTHLNDILQEINIIDIKDNFDSFICMSPEDAQYLIELGFDPCKVYGRTLPIRNTYIKPISIGIFSACYVDGRKNEKWLIEYCSKCGVAKFVNFVFVGKGWDRVVQELEKYGCSFEWHNVSRNMPFEYMFQQNKLSSLNYYIYMGMDGGAMGTYDAYAQDVPLCVTYDGFHKSIPNIEYTFDDKQTFFNSLDIITTKHAERLEFFKRNNVNDYVLWLIDVWSGKSPEVISDNEKKCISYKTVVEKKRDQYYNISFSSIKRFLSWQYYKHKVGKSYK